MNSKKSTRRGFKRKGDEFLPQDFQSPVVIQRWPTVRQIRLAPEESAAAAIGDIPPGCEIYGLTKGQFSAPELLAAILDRVGPSDVVIATWTMTTESADFLAGLKRAGRVKSCRLIIDRSFESREGEYCRSVVTSFGNENIRTTRNHAKFMLIDSGTRQIAVRTSMNFSADPRLEYFEISDDQNLYAFHLALVAELFERPAVFNFASDGKGVTFAASNFTDTRVSVEHLEDPRLTPSQAATMLEISKAMVTKLRNRGDITFDADGAAPRSRLLSEHAAYLAQSQPRSDRPRAESDGNSDTEDYYLNRARRERIKADREQLALDSERGALVDAVAASSAWFAIGRNLRNQLLMLPDVIAPAAIGLVRRNQLDAVAVAQVRELIDSKIRECLQTITDAPPKVEV